VGNGFGRTTLWNVTAAKLAGLGPTDGGNGRLGATTEKAHMDGKGAGISAADIGGE
jgi:hypothetical protein